MVPAQEHWVSSAAVRQAIGAWAYTLGAAATRPSNEAVRAAIAVACTVRELATDAERRAWSREHGETVDGPVPEDVSDLAARSGLPAADVDDALALLSAAHVVTRQSGAGGATVALAQGVLTPAPSLARIDWIATRERLRSAGGSVAAALAVLRELAALAGAFDPGAESPSVRASVRDLEDATAFGRSTVSEALTALDRARVLDVETRAGRTTRFVLRRAAFGLPDEEPRSAPAPMTGASAVKLAPAQHAAIQQVDRESRPSAHDRVTGTPQSAAVGAVALIGTFAGTPIYAPAGTPLVLDRDDQGRWLCRVGPLVLGPVESE